VKHLVLELFSSGVKLSVMLDCRNITVIVMINIMKLFLLCAIGTFSG
jgi:hypothetical protein